MSEHKYSHQNPEKTYATTLAEGLLLRSLDQFKRVASKTMTPEEFDQHEALTRTFYLASNRDFNKLRDPLLVDEQTYSGAYAIRLLGREVREITFTKDNGDISLGVEFAKEAAEGSEASARHPADRLPTHVVLSSNPDGVFINNVPVDLAIAAEAPLKPDSGNILQHLSFVMREIEDAHVVPSQA